MSVRIEFYGIPRQRAGMAAMEMEAGTLGEVLSGLRERLPGLGSICLSGGRLASGYLASINGRLFTSDPAQPLGDGDAVLLLSADVGG